MTHLTELINVLLFGVFILNDYIYIRVSVGKNTRFYLGQLLPVVDLAQFAVEVTFI